MDDQKLQYSRFCGYVNEYSARELGHNEDSLNAFLGIIRHFRSSKYPIWHLMGLPLVSVTNSTDELACHLAWCHSGYPRGSCRRPRFPSWSWVGWDGEATVPEFENNQGHCSNLGTPIIELNNGENVALRDFYSNSFSADSPSTYPRALHFDAYVLPPKAFELYRHKTLDYGMKIEIQRKSYAEIRYIHLSERPEKDRDILRYLREGLWSCIVLSTSNQHQFQEVSLLVVKWEGDSAHRVGVIVLGQYKGREITITSPKRRICLV
jgi:hypothetical protein